MHPPGLLVLVALVLIGFVSDVSAQSDPRAGGSLVRLEGGGYVDEETVRTARETVGHSVTLPEWTNPAGFEKDVFTFTRVIFWSDPSRPTERGGFRGSFGGGGGGRFGGFGGFGRMGWVVDYPDADLNFSHRLQQLTSMKVDPDARVLKLTSSDLGDYPFIYMEHIERLSLHPPEVAALRQYLLSGGVLLVNDFWGALAWQNLKTEISKVLPGRTWTELTKEHPIFHCVFEQSGPMSSLRVPSMQRWNKDYNPADPNSNPTAGHRGEGYETMHVQALLDERQRISVLAIHNSDISDGWEREGEQADYFKVFSEARAYPLGINIVFYLMTH
ncbi:MAG: hypothetical protein RIQ93_3402 [Verrucomicrobiota bacterium]|jgi:hypothetical protein